MERFSSEGAASGRGRQAGVSLPESQPVAGQGGEIDVAALLGAVKRHKWWVIVPTLAALIGSTLFVNLVTPRYTAETRVFLENRESFYTRPERDTTQRSDQNFDQEGVISQVQIATSRDIARAVIQRNNLAALPEFDPLLGGMSPLDKALTLLGLMKGPARSSPEDRVLEQYFEKLKVFPLARSRVLSFEFESRDPALAARLSADVANEYLRVLEEAKKSTASKAEGWLRTTIEPLRQRVIEAENRAEAYRSQNGLLVGANNTLISAQQLGELNTQLSTARAQQADLQAQAKLIREAIRAGRAFEVSQVVRDDTVRALIQTRANLRATLAQEGRTLLPQHPRMRELEAQVAGLEEQIRSAAERAARAMENDARAAGARVINVTAELERQKQIASQANESDVQQRALDREAKALREQLDGLVVRQRDAEARDQENALPADARIVSRPVVPTTPSFPKKVPIILLSTIGMLVITLASILTQALMSGAALVRPLQAGQAAGDRPVREIEPDWDAELVEPAAARDTPQPRPPVLVEPTAPSHAGMSAAAMPHMATPMPETATAPARFVAEAGEAAEDAMDRLRRRVISAQRDGGAASVVLLATDPGSRSAQTALTLARHMARSGRVILLDVAMRTGRYGRAMAAPLPLGLTELLIGEAAFGETIHRDRGSTLHIMPGGQAQVDLVDHAELLALTLDALSQTYDVVVMDADRAEEVLAGVTADADAVVVITAGGGEAEETRWRHQLAAVGIDEVLFTPPVDALPRAANDRAMLASVAE